jgi:hypothetical protein
MRDFDELLNSIDPGRLEFALLLVTPKQDFLDWLDRFKESRGLGEYKLYFRQEDSVWLIPRLVRFSGPEAIATFLEISKPNLLLCELGRFGAAEQDFDHPITAETFDTFFDVELREEIAVIPKPST